MANEEVMINTPQGIAAYLAGTFHIPGVHVIRASNGGMNMAVRSEGVVRGGGNDGEDRGIALNEKNEQILAQGLPPYVEMTRQGGGFSAIQTAATAALVVRPSTVAAITLWNGEGSGGKSYVIDRLFSHNLVSTAAESFFGIWATVHPAGMTNPGVDIARSATNLTGNSGKTYNGLGVVGVGETVVDNGWYIWGSGKAISASGVIPGSHASAEVAGRLIVPPQGGISVQVVASLVGCTFTSGLSWYEVQLDLD
jgi:hypothetical protein